MFFGDQATKKKGLGMFLGRHKRYTAAECSVEVLVIQTPLPLIGLWRRVYTISPFAVHEQSVAGYLLGLPQKHTEPLFLGGLVPKKHPFSIIL